MRVPDFAWGFLWRAVPGLMARSKKNRNRSRRILAHAIQQGRCYYCPAPVVVHWEKNGDSVLEHYTPRHQGGKVVVLACHQCDKAKGMISGAEFEALVAAHTIDGKINRTKLSGQCKARNVELIKQYPPHRWGESRTEHHRQK